MRVAIVNLRTGKMIGGMSCPSEPRAKRESVAAAFFLHDADELLIALKSSRDVHRFVRYRWDGTLLSSSFELGPGYLIYERPHGDHLIAVAKGDRNSARLEVRNWHTGQRVFATHVWNDHLHSDYIDWIGPDAALGEDGRSIFARGIGLVSLPVIALMRDAVKGFETRRMGVQANAFWTEEHWGAYVGDFEAPRTITLAQRSMQDGGLIVRLMPGPEPFVFSQSGALAATSNGEIYAWPPQVNVLLVILCQSILASPLILQRTRKQPAFWHRIWRVSEVGEPGDSRGGVAGAGDRVALAMVLDRGGHGFQSEASLRRGVRFAAVQFLKP